MSTQNADSPLGVARTVSALRARVDAWRADGQTIGFAPTMGALHEGHLSLIKRSRMIADRTVASIFVNPRQFAAGEDLATYPRDERVDLEMLQQAGCDLAFLPNPGEMYPDGYQTEITVPALAEPLCGVSRPHFFGGVATVVCKLLNQCRPDYAVFGEKDFQQLLIIQRMTRDLDMDIDIISAPIVREKDGLAMSSRNAYLSAPERAVAGRLNGVLAAMASDLESGETVADTLANGREKLSAAGFDSIDYLDIRRSDDLSLPGPGLAEHALRIFAAVILGKTRLIDNWPVEPHL